MGTGWRGVPGTRRVQVTSSRHECTDRGVDGPSVQFRCKTRAARPVSELPAAGEDLRLAEAGERSAGAGEGPVVGLLVAQASADDLALDAGADIGDLAGGQGEPHVELVELGELAAALREVGGAADLRRGVAATGQQGGGADDDR